MNPLHSSVAWRSVQLNMLYFDDCACCETQNWFQNLKFVLTDHGCFSENNLLVFNAQPTVTSRRVPVSSTVKSKVFVKKMIYFVCICRDNAVGRVVGHKQMRARLFMKLHLHRRKKEGASRSIFFCLKEKDLNFAVFSRNHWIVFVCLFGWLVLAIVT